MLPLYGPLVQLLVKKLRSHMLHSVVEKKKKKKVIQRKKRMQGTKSGENVEEKTKNKQTKKRHL